MCIIRKLSNAWPHAHEAMHAHTCDTITGKLPGKALPSGMTRVDRPGSQAAHRNSHPLAPHVTGLAPLPFRAKLTVHLCSTAEGERRGWSMQVKVYRKKQQHASRANQLSFG